MNDDVVFGASGGCDGKSEENKNVKKVAIFFEIRICRTNLQNLGIEHSHKHTHTHTNTRTHTR